MAKRGKKTTAKKATKKKTATPENPSPPEKSAVTVNAMHDAMPDTIEDPGAVFKLAYLDMKKVAINNKLAVVAQDYERKIVALNAERNAAINQIKAEMAQADNELRMQKETIENTYGIALRSYTYNDETGVLTKQAVLEDEEAAKERQRNSAESETDNPTNKTLH